jgi:hypothetical protein
MIAAYCLAAVSLVCAGMGVRSLVVNRAAPGHPELAERMESLGRELAAFAGERHRGDPQWAFDFSAESRENSYRYRRETHAQFHERFVGRIGAVVDEARALGYFIDHDLQMPAMGMLAGVHPLEGTATALHVLAGRARRGDRRNPMIEQIRRHTEDNPPEEGGS